MRDEGERFESAATALRMPLAVVVMFVGLLVVALASWVSSAFGAARGDKPTVVLVLGAFAGSSSWNGIAARLVADGYPVVAVANPLRCVKSDAAYVGDVVSSIRGPVVLVGTRTAAT